MRRKKMCIPLDEWKAVLVKDLLELQQLKGQDASTRMRRSMKEQEIGQHCCQAGERLGDPDLTLLKESLGLDAWHWHAYKAKVRPEQDQASTPMSGSSSMQEQTKTYIRSAACLARGVHYFNSLAWEHVSNTSR